MRIVFVLLVLTAVAIPFLKTDEYRASTVIWAHENPQTPLNQKDVAQSVLGDSARLQRIVDTYDLYKPMRASGNSKEAVLAKFRRDIRIEIADSVDGMKPQQNAVAIRVTYRSPQPPIAAQVCNQLASLTIEDNLRRLAAGQRYTIIDPARIPEKPIPFWQLLWGQV